jgi:hypothetical protein
MAKPTLDPREELRRNAIHQKQVADALSEATVQRIAAVAAADLEICRKLDRRLVDLNSDARALKEQRVLLVTQAAAANLAARTKARDEAIDTLIVPRLEAICVATEQFEAKLQEAAAAYAEIAKEYAAYKCLRRSRPCRLMRNSH